MATNTPNLGLLKKGPIADKNDTFNIEKMLNENWDKIDQAVSKASTEDAESGADDTKIMTPLKTKQAIEKLAPTPPLATTTTNGLMAKEMVTKLNSLETLEYKDVLNLVATQAGVISWGLPQAVDQTRISITLFRATKDITNLDYATCIADGSIIRTTLGKDAVSNVYTGLANSTKYWVKAFIQYAVGGKQYTSGGVTVTFTTPEKNKTYFYNSIYGDVEKNQCKENSGGWIEASKYGECKMTLARANIEIGRNGANSGISAIMIKTNNKIDTTKIKTLYIEYDGAVSNLSAVVNAGVGVTGFNSGETMNGTPFSRRIASIDVSSYTGVNIYPYIKIESSNGGTYCHIYKVWGED